MNEKEMIEEMAKEIFNTCAWRFGKPNDYKEICKDIAEDLIKLNYRKIPEGSVVLSKEEKQKLLKEMYEQGKFDALADLEKEGKVVISKEEYEILINQNKGLREENHTLRLENNDLEAQVEKVRKETAKEILKEVKSLLFPEEGGLLAWLIAIADKYGVEVEK